MSGRVKQFSSLIRGRGQRKAALLTWKQPLCASPLSKAECRMFSLFPGSPWDGVGGNPVTRYSNEIILPKTTRPLIEVLEKMTK